MRSRPKFVSTVLSCALIAGLMPAVPAQAVVDRGGAVSVNRPPVKSPKVRTSARSDKIVVALSGLPREVVGFDVYRSEAAGVQGEKVNDEPVRGTRFFDTSALPGVQYHYTVRPIRPKRAAGPVRARSSGAEVPAALDQVAAEVIEPEQQRSRGDDERERPPKKATAAAVRTAKPADPDVVASLSAVTYGSGGSVTTLTANTVWTPAAGPYFIRGDLIVPAGRTLTIMPGTKVYFDTVSSGSATEAPHPGVQSVTSQVDLIVHGRIVAKGTRAAPILFTSINSLAASATADNAQAGDWGCVFTDSKAASEISNCVFEFGTHGIWAHNTLRPYVRDSVFRDNSGDFPWGAVSFTNPPAPDATTPRIIISGNTIDGDEGIDILLHSLGTDTADRVCDPYIVGNTVTGSHPLEIYCVDDVRSGWPAHGGQSGNTLIKGYVANNAFITDQSEAVYLWARARGAGKRAVISTVFSGNRMVSSSGVGVDVEASAEGANGSAYARPTFTRDKITSTSDDAVSVSARAEEAAATSVGHAYATPRFTSCDVRAYAGDAVQLEAEASAKGTASANAVFSGGRLESVHESVLDAEAESELGPAHASPLLSNVTARSRDGDDALAVVAQANAKGRAVASPRWVGGALWASDGTGMWVEATSDEGSTEANPLIQNTTVRSYDAALDAYAESSSGSGSGGAMSSPVVKDSELISSDDNALEIEARVYGSGNATVTPTVSGSSLVAEDYYGLEGGAYSNGGSSVCSPVITDSTIWSYDSCVSVEAVRSGDGTRVAGATASPRFTRVTAVAKYDDAVHVRAQNQGVGNATVRPVVSSSDIVNSYDYAAFYASAGADQTGTAEVAPTMSATNLKSDYEAVDLEAEAGSAGGIARTRGTFTSCTMSSSWDNGLYAYAFSRGRSEVSPRLTSCTMEAPRDHGAEFDAYIEGPAATLALAAPVMTGGKVSYSGDGIGVWASTYDSACPAPVRVAPTISNLPVVSLWDVGIYTWASTTGNGDATNDAYVYNCPTTATGSGVANEARCEWSSSGTAMNRARTLGVSSTRRMSIESSNDCGVYNAAYSALGEATDRTEQRNLSVSAREEAVHSQAQASSGTGVEANASPIVTGVVADWRWGANAAGIYVAATGTDATTTAAPVISNNRLEGTFDDGISVSAYGSGPVAARPVITGNTISDVTGNGIYVVEDGSGHFGSVTIARNRITRPGLLGIYIDEVPAGTVSRNRVTNPGWGYREVEAWNTASLAWYRADHARAAVTSNLFVGGRFGVFYVEGAPRTTYNYFADATGGVNRPFNYGTDDDPSSVTPYDATKNWWGSANAAAIEDSISWADNYGLNPHPGPKSAIVDYSNPLVSLRPRVSAATRTIIGSRIRFKVTFDRPMNTAVRTLYFGSAAPYRAFSVTGTWSSDGRTFTGTRARAGLPRGTVYFSGAKDLWGNVMIPTSKGLKL